MMSFDGRSSKDEIRGERFIVVLFRTIRAIRLHDDNNELVGQCLSQLTKAASEILAESEFTVLILDGGYYVQGRRFRYHKRTGRIVQELLDIFTERGFFGFTFHPAMLNAPPANLLKFLRLLIRSFDKDNPHEWLSHEIEDGRFSWVDLIDEETAKVLRDQSFDNTVRARITYQRSLASIRDVTRKLARGSRAGLWNSKRVVQNMVDLVRDDEALSIGMATIKHYDDYTYTHSVNVAILSVCLGNRMGLSRGSLTQLGVCGLFHDLGKVEIDPAIIQKPGKLNEQEWEQVKKHPVGSMRQILKLNTSYDLKSKVFISPLEHHLNFDLSGYPAIKSKRKISLFGRILRIADVYDAVTSPRTYRSFHYSPDQVLRMMFNKSGADFDPVLLKVFALMLGRFPIGTLLVLNTNELGLVIGNSPGPAAELPRVMLLLKNSEGGFARGETVDLNDQDPRTGEAGRTIIRALHPAVCGIQPAEFFLSGQ